MRSRSCSAKTAARAWRLDNSSCKHLQLRQLSRRHQE
jgi:hypothetical protein